jgi:hypothetical protein
MPPKSSKKAQQPIGFLSTRVKKAKSKYSAFQIFISQPVCKLINYISFLYNLTMKTSAKKKLIKKSVRAIAKQPNNISLQSKQANEIEKQSKQQLTPPMTVAKPIKKRRAPIKTQVNTEKPNVNTAENISLTEEETN